MKKTLLIMVIALVFLLGNTLNAVPKAQRSKMMRHSGFGMKMAEKNMIPARMLLNFKAEIGLTDVQVKKIEKMQLNYQEYVVKSSADAKLIGIKISSEFNMDKVNRKKVTGLIKKVGAVKTEMQVARVNYLLDVKSVLTKAQIDKINALKKERRYRRSNKSNRSNRMGNKNRTNRTNKRGRI